MNTSKNDVAADAKRRELNDRMMLAERWFLDSEGIKGKEWFKHLVYGPAAEPESKLGFFPGIADAVATHSSEGTIQHEIWRVARAIHRTSKAPLGSNEKTKIVNTCRLYMYCVTLDYRSITI
ncbi:unnamed protein product [Eruca vesicaria subsp. sativa]|uniref:Transferrin receptor-like dimerisation domain-containing protein n=1 Tax=Eruca vesicaria subsp. sativa TaxID=29727 RepID=A0ABC8L2S4_ERUVS|nr:unnamed protein product [Eruca vesicaria subsp. sativa]